MQLQIRHICLLIGIISTIVSFLFFGRAQSTYSFLLIGGLLVAVISYSLVLIKDLRKTKLAWTGIVILSVIIQQLVEKSFIQQSFKILIDQNSEVLDKVNSIFISKQGDILCIKKIFKDSATIFSSIEKEIIDRLFTETNIHLIHKDSSKIFYETYGMLDVRIGITYRFSKSPTDFRTGLNTFIGKWNY